MPQAIGTYTGASNNTSNTKTYTSNAGTSWDTTSTSLSNAVISTSLTANAPELTSAVPSSVSSPITSPARLSPSISVDLSSTVEDSEILYTTTIWSDEQPSEIDPAHPDDSELEDVEIVSCDTTEHETWFTGEETVTATATGGNFTAGGKGNGTVSYNYLTLTLHFLSEISFVQVAGRG